MKESRPALMMGMAMTVAGGDGFLFQFAFKMRRIRAAGQRPVLFSAWANGQVFCAMPMRGLKARFT